VGKKKTFTVFTKNPPTKQDWGNQELPKKLEVKGGELYGPRDPKNKPPRKLKKDCVRQNLQWGQPKCRSPNCRKKGGEGKAT